MDSHFNQQRIFWETKHRFQSLDLHDRHKIRGNFLAILPCFEGYIPLSENDRQLWRTICVFCESANGTLNDWDRLIDWILNDHHVSLEEYFSVDRYAIKPRFEEHSPLLDAIAVCLEPTIERQHERLKKRFFTDWLSSEKPILNTDTVQQAFSEMINDQKTSSIIDASSETDSLHTKTQAIKECLNQDTVNVDVLNLLLGPRLFEARAHAAQHFFNPETMLFYHLYWILLSTAQITFSYHRMVKYDLKMVRERRVDIAPHTVYLMLINEKIYYQTDKVSFQSMFDVNEELADSSGELYYFMMMQGNITEISASLKQKLFQALLKVNHVTIDSEESGWLLVNQFHKNEKNTLRLKTLLNQMAISYIESFPYLNSNIHQLMNSLFKQDELRYDLLSSVSFVFDLIQKRSPAYGNFFLPPTGEKDPECRAYTRANLEKKAILLEKNRYYEEAFRFLMQAPEKTLNEVLSALNREPVQNTSSTPAITRSLRASEIADLLTHLPNSREHDTEDWLLHPAVRPLPIADLFLSRGAPMLSQTYTEWGLLSHALNYLMPKNFQDEVFRQSIQEYCRLPPRKWFKMIQTTHSPERFGCLYKGIQESRRSDQGFFDATKQAAQRVIKFHEKRSLLLATIMAYESIRPELLFPFFFQTLAFLTYFTDALSKDVFVLNKKNPDMLCAIHHHMIVDFSGYRFSPVTARQHAYPLRRNASFKTLKLNDQSFETYKAEKIPRYRDVFDYFLRALPYYHRLEVLELNNSEINDESFIQLIKKIALLQNLLRLSVNNNLMTDAAVFELHDFMIKRFRRVCPQLREMDLSGNFITPMSIPTLKEACSRFRSLETVILTGLDLTFFSDEIREHLDRLSTSNESSIGYEERPSSSTRDSFSAYRGASIDGYNPREPSYFIQEKTKDGLSNAIPAALTAKKNQASIRLTEEEQQYWFQYLQDGVLAPLITEENTNDLIRFLQGMPNDSLIQLDLKQTRMDISQFELLLRSLIRFSSLTHLDLSNIDILSSDAMITNPDGLSPKIARLAEALPTLPALACLVLTDRDLTETEVDCLLEAIKQTPSLRIIDFANFIRKKFRIKIDMILGARQMKDHEQLCKMPHEHREYKTFTKKDSFLSPLPEKYHLIPIEIDEISLQWNDHQSLHDCIDALAASLIDQHHYPNRFSYYMTLHGELYAALMARALLSTGLFTQAEQGDLGTYADIGSALVQSAMPIGIPISFAVMGLIHQIDASERQTFNKKISYLFRHHRQEHIQPLSKVFALLLLLKYIDNCQEYCLSSDQCQSDVAQIVQFLSDYNSLIDPVSLEMSDRRILVLRKITGLMQLCFDETHCVIPMKWTDWLQCRASLDAGISILDRRNAEELTIPATFMRPCSHRFFRDATLAPALREQEEMLRSTLIYVAHSYLARWGEAGFYQNVVNHYIKCHGGQDTIRFCIRLIIMAKTLPYYNLIQALRGILQEIETVSGWRKESLQTRLVTFLASAGRESGESINTRQTLSLFFSNKSTITSIKENILDSYDRYDEAQNMQH